jgi:outer membrane protein
MRSFAVKKSILALTCLAVGASLAPAQTTCTAPSKVGILQAEAALAGTKEGIAVNEEIKKRFDPRVAELQKREGELRDIQDKISRGANTMAAPALAELQKSFDQKKKAFDRDKQDFQDEAQAAENKVLGELSEKLKKVIDKYRQDNCIALILNVSDPNTPVVSFSDEIDITPAIIEAYDKTAGTAKPPVSSVKPAATKPVAPAAPKTTPPPAAPPK